MQIDVQKVVDMISNFKFEHYKNQNLIQSSTPQKSPEVYEKKENEENNQLVLASDVNKIKSDREEGMNSTQNSLTKHNRVHTLAEDSKASTTPFQKLDTMKRRNESSNIEINNKVDENQYKTKFEKIKVLPVNQNRNPENIRKEHPQKLEMVVNFAKDDEKPIPKSKSPLPESEDLPRNFTTSNINSTQEVFPTPSQRYDPTPVLTNHISKKKKEMSRNNLNNMVKNTTPLEPNKKIPQKVFCVGDEQFLLEYNISEDSWEAKAFQENSVSSTGKNSCFKGNLKYPSVCRIGDTEDYILVGGCSILTNKATQSCYTFKISIPEKIEQISSMLYPRYGHCSAYCNGYVFAIGGFSMDDNIDVEPNTLSLCEKYHIKEDIWSPCEPLNIPRAYSGIVCFPQHIKKKESFTPKLPNSLDTSSAYIYIFGGLFDFSALDSIEKYDSMLDIWILLSIKMPIKLAKIGISILDYSKILICGGIFSNADEEFNYINTVYQLDFDECKWSKMPSMNENRVLYQIMPRSSNKIFAIGGSFEGKCEFFDIATKKWQVLNSYGHLLPENDLQTFTVFI